MSAAQRGASREQPAGAILASANVFAPLARALLDAGNASPEDKLTFAEATIRLGRADDGERALGRPAHAGAGGGRHGAGHRARAPSAYFRALLSRHGAG